MDNFFSMIQEGEDAVFLPGKIHGCEDQVYILYLNPQACGGKGSFEIEIIDYERIIQLNDEVNGNAEEFFDKLPDLFHGEWRYCDFDSDDFKNYVEEYFKADFIVGRDGNMQDELSFIVNWAKSRTGEKKNMKLRIYQIAPELDAKHLMFRDLQTNFTQSNGKIPEEIYEMVYEGEHEAQSLEDVYRIFNCAQPRDYHARSLSVSDVVEVIDSSGKSNFYFCDSFGFKFITFDKAAVHTGRGSKI